MSWLLKVPGVSKLYKLRNDADGINELDNGPRQWCDSFISVAAEWLAQGTDDNEC